MKAIFSLWNNWRLMRRLLILYTVAYLVAVVATGILYGLGVLVPSSWTILEYVSPGILLGALILRTVWGKRHESRHLANHESSVMGRDEMIISSIGLALACLFLPFVMA